MKADWFPPWLRRVGIEVAGWLLIIIGLAALVLPGPGLLALASGLALLSLRYRWAHRFLHPVKTKALDTAEKGVQTWPRISASVAGALTLMALGIIWGGWAEPPHWWPYGSDLWLPGGWATGAGLIFSGMIALGLIIYSYRKFRRPGVRDPRKPKPVDPAEDHRDSGTGASGE